MSNRARSAGRAETSGADEEDDTVYNPTVAGSAGATRTPSVVPDASEINPFILMEDIVDKLKLLNYERNFCRGKSFKPLSRFYFAMPANNPNEQFFYFTSLTSWLMNLQGHSFPPPSQYDDPNATATSIHFELKKLGIPTDFPPSKLKQANGDAVCFSLNALCDGALRATKFVFKLPELPDKGDSGYTEEVEPDEEADVTDAVDAVEEDEEDMFVPQKESHSDAPSTTIVESTIDPIQWRMELERVTPQLKIRIAADPKDWRSHVEQMKTLQQTVEKLHPDVAASLNKIAEDIVKVIEKVNKREKSIGTQFEHLVVAYKERQRELNETQDLYKKSTENITALSNELNRISEELEAIKTQMDERGNKMSDTSPLVRIKEALQKLKTEIQAMEVRIGVIQHTLLHAKFKHRISSANAKTAAPETYDSLDTAY